MLPSSNPVGSADSPDHRRHINMADAWPPPGGREAMIRGFSWQLLFFKSLHNFHCRGPVGRKVASNHRRKKKPCSDRYQSQEIRRGHTEQEALHSAANEVGSD